MGSTRASVQLSRPGRLPQLRLTGHLFLLPLSLLHYRALVPLILPLILLILIDKQHLVLRRERGPRLIQLRPLGRLTDARHHVLAQRLKQRLIIDRVSNHVVDLSISSIIVGASQGVPMTQHAVHLLGLWVALPQDAHLLQPLVCCELAMTLACQLTHLIKAELKVITARALDLS